MDVSADIRELPVKKLLGIHREMSVAENQTSLLWQSFMPQRGDIGSTVSKDLWAVQLYPSHYFEKFDPTTRFIKWAAAEVDVADNIPKGMELLNIPAGLYAVFLYKGHSGNPDIFHHIFGDWLPGSGYHLDNRPHFELLGEKFKLNDPSSEEEIWIPVRNKP